MLTAEQLRAFHRAISETERDNLEGLSIQALRRYRKFLLEVEPWLSDLPLQTRCRDHIQQIDRELESRRREEKADHRHERTEEKADQRHKASYKIEKWILGFAIAGVVIGILTLVAEYVPLIRDIFFSKVQPASAPQSTPSSPYQKPTSTAESPGPEASSNTAKPSPEQTATAQPSATTTAPNTSPTN